MLWGNDNAGAIMGEVLIVLVVLLTIVTLVGHGIWVMLAAVARTLAPAPGSPRPQGHKRCPLCGYANSESADRCVWCGKPIGVEAASEMSDLAAMRRQLGRLRAQAAMDPGEVEGLLARLDQYERRLRQPATAPRPAETAPAAAPKPRPEAPAVVSAPPPLPPVAPKFTVEAPPAAPAACEAQPVLAKAAPPKPKPQAPPPPPPPPKKSWMELVAEFFEERNVRLAEVILVLVGGLLIVGGSVAVVVSFWEQMESYLKFAVFVGVSSAVFGLGLLAYHRWKLEISGRGLLLIATLLVPLDFLAMASLSREDWTLLTLATELVSLAIFVYLVGLASQVLVPGRVWHEVLAVVGNSAAVLLVARLTGEGAHGWTIGAVGLLPVGILAVSLGSYLSAIRKQALESRYADGIFALAGTAGFAMSIAVGLLIAKSARADGLAVTLQHVAPLIALAAVPFLSAGLTVKRRIGDYAAVGAYSTAGTAIALAAMATMLAALALAWPRPIGVMAVGLFDAAALAHVAMRHRLPIAHAGAIACAAIVYLLAFHLAAGNLAWDSPTDQGRRMIELAFGARSGTALVGLFALLALAGEWLARRGLRDHAAQYVGGSAAVALASLLLVTAHNQFTGGASAIDAMLVYGIYGSCSLAMAARWKRHWFSYLGLGLLAGTTLWALWWQFEHIKPVWSAVFAGEALGMGLVVAVLNRLAGRPVSLRWNAAANRSLSPLDRNPSGLIEVYRIPLLRVAEVVGMVGLGFAVWTYRIQATPAPVVAAACLALLSLMTAWGYRSQGRTWLASALVLAGLVHTLAWNYSDWVQRPWELAFLSHATLAAVASMALTFSVRREGEDGRAADLRRVFVRPLWSTSLISSTAVLPLVFAVPGIDALLLAEYLFWLAALWLAVAWNEGRPGLFAAAQVVLTMATTAATTAWLQRHPWDAAAVPTAVDLGDARTLQCYGIALALMSLVWGAVRLLLGKNEIARRLLDPAWPAVDHVVGHAVAAAHLLLAGAALAIACARELAGWPGHGVAWPITAFGPAAWLLVGFVGLGLVTALWHRWRDAEMLSGLAAAATTAYVAAGSFAADHTAAIAAGWALAVGFVVLSATIWLRRGLRRLCVRAGAKVEWGPFALDRCHALVLAATAAPALVVTILGQWLRIQGLAIASDGAVGFFAGLDSHVVYVAPQVLVIVGLVGLAIRERAAGYAFFAGLIVDTAVVFGYLVHLVAGGRALDTEAAVTSVQWATVATAIWALVWLTARRWLRLWRESPGQRTARAIGDQAIMDLQLGMGSLGNVVLLVPALAAIVFYPGDWQSWAVYAGSPWGWAALLLAAAAVFVRQYQVQQRWQPQAAGLVGIATVALLACTARRIWPDVPEWAYRTSMLGYAAYAVLVAATAWAWASYRQGGGKSRFTSSGTVLPEDNTPQPTWKKTRYPIISASRWTALSGVFAVLLALKSVWLHPAWEGMLWAAAAVGLVATAWAATAVWRRAEGWAFAAALCVNLGTSLVVWYTEGHGRPSLGLEEWWVHLVQANAIASAVTTIVWLAVRRTLETTGGLKAGASPFLTLQVLLGIVANGILLLPALAHVAETPGRLPAWLGQAGEPAGWLALLLIAASAAWYLCRSSPRALTHVVACLGLGGGILAACACARWNLGTALGDWLAYHMLEATWAAVAFAVLGLGLLGRNWRWAAQDDPSPPNGGSEAVFPAGLVQGWVTWIGAALVGLAWMYAAADPGAPWWSVGTILAASLSAGILALGLRLPGYVCLSGLLLNAAGSLMWWVWGPWNPYALVEFNVVSLAIASGLWSVVGLLYRPGVPRLEIGERHHAFAHLAAELAVTAMAALAAVFVAQDVQLMPHAPVDRLAWLALAAAAAATAACLWDRSAAFVLPGLYVLGVAAIGLAWDARGLASHALAWASACELAAFALAAGLAALLLPHTLAVQRILRIPVEREKPHGEWFPRVQAAVCLIAAGLATWIAIDLGFDATGYAGLGWPSGRMGGLVASALLLPTAIAMATVMRARWRTFWQYTTLAFLVLVLSTPGWTLLQPDWGDLGMHRSVVLMVAAIVAALTGGFGLERIVPSGSDWVLVGRRAFVALTGLGLVALATVIGQELHLYVPFHGAPMALPAVVVVAVALAGLFVGCIACALTPRLDPFGLSDRGRTAYVYAAELIALVICVHLRLTVPDLFRLAIVTKYWMLMAMGLAFGGAGLSELFHRRGLPVLSEPLERTAMLLPLAPAIGFWFVPDFLPHEKWLLAGRSPGVWLLAAIFYGFLAATRRGRWQTVVFTLLSLAAANVGLAVMWHQYDARFFWAHPQVWLIPIGLSILLAEYLNQDRLTAAQSAGIRYLALSVIYVPSSAEYLQAIGQSIWLPLLLILLSVLGVLAGIVLRIRSFLYLGVAFLGVVLTTMVRYAAVDLQKTWVLYLCCIFLGAIMFALVALYEKRRDALLAAIRQFRQWQK